MKILMHIALLGFLCLASGCTSLTRAVQQPDLVFWGTVESVEASPLPQSELNWIVHCRVDQVLYGDFSAKTFSFRVHSPSKSGLEVGKQYRIEAKRTADGYSIDQYQWNKGPGAQR